jgi:hypothetical protein
MHSTGHQIASHTWSHQDLSKITMQQMQDQIYYNEMALRNILGFFPQYMRPPYSSCTDDCQAFLTKAGYHVIYFDLDTEDYLHPTEIQISKNYVAGNLSQSGNPKNKDWLVIGHDIVQQESYSLTEFMLKQFQDKGFKLVTVGECLGDPATNWYRAANDTVPRGTSSAPSTAAPARTPDPPASTAPTNAPAPPPAMPVSRDAQCGAAAKTTCQESAWGNCCSQNGWCGPSLLYCGTGCQPGYGGCGVNATTVSAAPPSGVLVPSVDASCGGASGYTCVGSTFGNCCSEAGWW